MTLDDANLREILHGKTLQVYTFMLKSSSGTSFGVREIQRKLKFKSPSTASYHLEKLQDLGLLSKTDDGNYQVSKEVNLGFLRLYVRVSRYRLPRFMIYAIFSTTLLVTYLLAYPQTLDPYNLFAVLFGLSSSVIFWFEAIRIMRDSP